MRLQFQMFRCTMVATALATAFSSTMPKSTANMALLEQEQMQQQQLEASFLRPAFMERNLQNIVISYPDGEEGNDAAPTRSSLDATSNGSSDRSTTTIVCQNLPDAISKRLDFSIRYSVETDSLNADIPQAVLAKQIPALVAEESITVMASSVCPGVMMGRNTDDVPPTDDGNDNDDNVPSPKKATRFSGSTSADSSDGTMDKPYSGSAMDESDGADSADGSMDESGPSNRRLEVNPECIISVSSGAPGKRISSCSPSLADSASCDVFEDTFSVLYTGDCSEEDIVSESVSAISKGIGSNDFLASVNEKTADSGVTFTLIELYNDESGQVVASPTTTSDLAATSGMTVVGKSTVACLALVALFVGSAMYVRHRNRSNRNFHAGGDDDKSVHTQWSNKTDDNSYVQPDWHDLLFRHSKMDVHKCKSVLCDVCQPNLGLVHTVRVPQSANVRSLQLDGTSKDLKPETTVANSSSSKSRRSLEPLDDLEPTTQADLAVAPSMNNAKQSWRAFGRNQKSNTTANDEVEKDDMICHEISIPSRALVDDEISFVASSSTRSIQSDYSVKEVLL